MIVIVQYYCKATPKELLLSSNLLKLTFSTQHYVKVLIEQVIYLVLGRFIGIAVK